MELVEPGGMPRVFWRIVKTDPPTVNDFLSAKARGRRLRTPTPELLRVFDGVSVYDSEAQARATARAYPRLGRFIARLEISADVPIDYEPTLGEGHFTLWGDPATLLACVASVVPL